MTEENLFYWLQGYFELAGGTSIIPIQQRIIDDHIDLIPESPAKRMLKEFSRDAARQASLFALSRTA